MVSNDQRPPRRIMMWSARCMWGALLLGLSARFLEACSQDSSDYKKIGICLHTYLERDFPSIEMIVYSKDRSAVLNKNKYKLEGPKMDADCHHLEQVLNCFTEVLKGCYYMEDFFQYRRLISSLQKTLSWLCGDIQAMRTRFEVVLKQLHCFEEVWKNQCKFPEIRGNVWNRVLRLEDNVDLCGSLLKQRQCLVDSVDSRGIRYKCGVEAHVVYTNISHVFLSSWCSAAAGTTHVAGSTLATLPLTLFLVVSFAK